MYYMRKSWFVDNFIIIIVLMKNGGIIHVCINFQTLSIRAISINFINYLFALHPKM